MITAREASEKLASMSPLERLEALKHKVSESTRNALDAKIRETVASYSRKVNISLLGRVCRDPDKDIENLLRWLGYVNVKVTSDFPSYDECYEGSTTIKFEIPWNPEALPSNFIGYGD